MKHVIGIHVFVVCAIIVSGVPYVSGGDDSAGAVNMDMIIREAEIVDGMADIGVADFTYEYVLTDTTSDWFFEEQEMLNIMNQQNSLSARRLSLGRKSTVKTQYEGRKIRVEEDFIDTIEKGKTEHIHRLYAYNGEKTDELVTQFVDEDEIPFHRGRVVSKRHVLDKRYDPRYYGFFIGGSPVAAFLRGDAELLMGKQSLIVETPEYRGEENRGGIRCSVFHAAFQDGLGECTVWLAPSRMYRPVSIEIRTARIIMSAETEYGLGESNVWLPVRTEVKTHLITDGAGTKVLRRIDTVEIGSFEIKRDIPDTMFAIAFEKKTRIYDERTGHNYQLK